MIEMFRLLGAPSKVEFLRNGMNVIDVLAVVPYYVELSMAQVDTSGGVRGAGGHNTTALDTLEVNQLFVNITPASGSVDESLSHRTNLGLNLKSSYSGFC